MYTDRTCVRYRKVKVSLSEREDAILDELCAKTGEQKATLLRELVMQRAVQVLHDDQCGAPPPGLRDTQKSLRAA